MKKYFPVLTLAVVNTAFAIKSYAQEKGLDIDIDINKKEWYEEPWALITGGAILLLLVVLAVRKRK